MDKTTKRLETAQKEIDKCLPPDAILVGQSLCGDLKVLKVGREGESDRGVGEKER